MLLMSPSSPQGSSKLWLGQPLVLVMLFGSWRTVNLLLIWESVEVKVLTFSLWWLSPWVAGVMKQFLSFKELVTCWVRDLVSLRTFLFDNLKKKLLVTLWLGNATLLLRRRHPGPLAPPPASRSTFIPNSLIYFAKICFTLYMYIPYSSRSSFITINLLHYCDKSAYH